MRFKLLGWTGFVFLAAGLLILIFAPDEWRSWGCGAILTAVTLYGTGLVMVAVQIARLKREADAMMRRVSDEMERRRRPPP